MVREGGLGADLSDLPVAGCAPEWMSEKAVAIGQYFVASGALVVFGVGLPIEGSREVNDYLTGGIAKELGGRWAIEPDPKRMAQVDPRAHRVQARRARHQREEGTQAVRHGRSPRTESVNRARPRAARRAAKEVEAGRN